MRIHHATIAKAKKFNITLTVEDNEVVATAKDGTQLASGLQGNKVLEDAIVKITGHVAKRAVKAAPIPVVSSLTLVFTEETETHLLQQWKILASVDEADDTEYAYTTRTEIGDTEFTGRGLDRVFKMLDGSATTARDVIGQAVSGEIELTDDGETYDFSEQEDEVDPSDDEIEAEDEEGGNKSVVKAKYKTKYKPTKNRCGDELSHRMNQHCSREGDDGAMRIDLNALRKFAKANECWVEGYASLKSRTGGWNSGMAAMNCANRLRARLRRIAKEQERAFDINKDIVWK